MRTANHSGERVFPPDKALAGSHRRETKVLFLHREMLFVRRKNRGGLRQ